jgi:hypothetical protein
MTHETRKDPDMRLNLALALALGAVLAATPAASQTINYYIDSTGHRVPVTPATPLPVADVAGYSFCHISTSTTTTCKASAGVLHTVTVSNLGTVASTVTVYNNTAGSGAVIAVINTLAGQTSYVYDLAFSTGLTVVSTGTAAPDVTITYR